MFFCRILNLFLYSLWTHVMPWHRSCDIGCDRHKSLGSNKRRKSKKEKAEKKLAIWKKANFTPAKAFLISEMTHVCNINSSRSWFFFVDSQLLNSCAQSWNKFFSGRQNKDELPYIRNWKKNSGKYTSIRALLHFFFYLVKGCTWNTFNKEKWSVLTAPILQAKLTFTISK